MGGSRRQKHGIKPFTKGKDLVKFSMGVAEKIHKNHSRESGEVYINHPEAVSRKFDGFTKETEYKDSGICAGKLHDTVEKTRWAEVLNPFIPPRRKYRKILYLNDVFKEAGVQGDMICYMVDKLTKRFYDRDDDSSYVDGIFSITPPDGDHIHQLMNIADLYVLALKDCDWDSNTVPDEKIDERVIEEEYEKAMEKERGFNIFSKKFGITDLKGTEPFKMIIETHRKNFEYRKSENARKNADIYIPRSEKILLVEPGIHKGKFDIGKAKDNPLFDYDKLRDFFEEWGTKTLQILNEHKTYRLGSVTGYKSVLRKIASSYLTL